VNLEEAAVVWGREVMRIRDDRVLIEHNFYADPITVTRFQLAASDR
jgi:hypothetical protein